MKSTHYSFYHLCRSLSWSLFLCYHVMNNYTFFRCGRCPSIPILFIFLWHACSLRAIVGIEVARRCWCSSRVCRVYLLEHFNSLWFCFDTCKIVLQFLRIVFVSMLQSVCSVCTFAHVEFMCVHHSVAYFWVI